jgi:hypothetical protein
MTKVFLTLLTLLLLTSPLAAETKISKWIDAHGWPVVEAETDGERLGYVVMSNGKVRLLKNGKMGAELPVGGKEAEPLEPTGEEIAGLSEGDGELIDWQCVVTGAGRTNLGGDSQVANFCALNVERFNEVMVNNGLLTRLRLVAVQVSLAAEVTDSAQALSQFALLADGNRDEIHPVRDQFGADLVSLFQVNLDACGRGYVNKPGTTFYATTGFNVVQISCAIGNLSSAHELGHNLGLCHDRPNATSQCAYTYSYGYVNTQGNIRDVMSYPSGNTVRVPMYSDALRTYQNKVIGTPTEDNARTLANMATWVSQYRTASAAPPPSTPPASTPCAVSTADPLSIAASPLSVLVGTSYAVTVCAYGADVHVIQLDGQAGFMADATCTGVAGAPDTTCYKTVTRTPLAAGTVTHTLTAVHRDGAPWPSESVTVTVEGGTAPPPSTWTAQYLTVGNTPYFGIGASGSRVVTANGSGTVYVRVSTDHGASGAWKAIGGGTIEPERAVAVVGETVLIGAGGPVTGTFTDFCCPREGRSVIAFVSRDGGGTFQGYGVSPTAKMIRYSVAIDRVTGDLHMNWMEWTGASWNIAESHWLAGAPGWSAPRVVAAGVNATGEGRPTLTARNGLVRHSWMSGADGKPPCTIEGGAITIPQCTEIHSVRSVDRGVTLGSRERLTNSSAYAGRPSAVVLASGVEVIAFDRRPVGEANEIAVLVGTPSGWEGPFLVAPALAESTHAVLAERPDGGVRALWMDQRDCPVNYCLYTASSSDGRTWSAAERLSTTETPAPQLAASSGYVLALTSDGIPGRLILRRLAVSGAQ